MLKVRHWRETYDPKAEYVFSKNLAPYKTGDIAPKDFPYSKERWLWKSGYLTRRDFYTGDVNDPAQEEKQASPLVQKPKRKRATRKTSNA